MTPPVVLPEAKKPMKRSHIPGPTIKRLSLYLRHLEDCVARAVRTISSKQLGETLNLTDTQVRKDLAYLGPFGQPGVGYRVQELARQIRRILGTDKTWNGILVGAGNLGRALAAYQGSAQKGFDLVAVFDTDEAKVGQLLPGCSEEFAIQHMRMLATVVDQRNAKLGILAVPARSAQAVAEQMIAAGIKGILNFAPVSLNVPDDVAVSSVDLAVHLEQLSFQISANTEDNDEIGSELG